VLVGRDLLDGLGHESRATGHRALDGPKLRSAPRDAERPLRAVDRRPGRREDSECLTPARGALGRDEDVPAADLRRAHPAAGVDYLAHVRTAADRLSASL